MRIDARKNLVSSSQPLYLLFLVFGSGTWWHDVRIPNSHSWTPAKDNLPSPNCCPIAWDANYRIIQFWRTLFLWSCKVAIESPNLTTRREIFTISCQGRRRMHAHEFESRGWVEKVAISSNCAMGGLPQFFCTPLPLFATSTIVNHYWWSLASLTLTFNIQSRCTPMSPSRRSSIQPCVYVCVAKKVFDHRTYNATKVRLPNSHTRSMHLDLFKACLRITRWLSKCYLTYLLLSNVIGHWLFR